MSIDRLATRSGGVIGTTGPIRGSGVFSLQERYALTADNYEDVSLYLKMNGPSGSTTFYDSSLYGHTVTANGNAQISTAQSKFGGASAAFDGSGDYLTVPSSSAFSFGTGDFTIESWVRWTSLPSVADGDDFVRLLDGANLKAVFYIYNDAGNIRFTFFANDTNKYVGQLTNVSLSLNQWYHVAAVRSSGVMKTYLNGSLQATGTLSANLASDHIVTVGGYSGGRSLNGYFDDLRITKGVARYTANFTPPTSPHPHL